MKLANLDKVLQLAADLTDARTRLASTHDWYASQPLRVTVDRFYIVLKNPHAFDRLDSLFKELIESEVVTLENDLKALGVEE